MAENRFIYATVKNNNTSPLVVSNAPDPQYGKWIFTPRNVSGLSIANPAFYAAGAAGSATGTNGSVSYKLGASNIKITWDIPYTGANSFSISCDDPSIGVSSDSAQHLHDNGCYVTFTVR